MAMSITAIDASAVPADWRPRMAAGYRELAEGNRLLHAATGSARYLELARLCEQNVAALEYGGVLRLEGGEL